MKRLLFGLMACMMIFCIPIVSFGSDDATITKVPDIVVLSDYDFDFDVVATSDVPIDHRICMDQDIGIDHVDFIHSTPLELCVRLERTSNKVTFIYLNNYESPLLKGSEPDLSLARGVSPTNHVGKEYITFYITKLGARNVIDAKFNLPMLVPWSFRT